jgi:hypothetical protein
VSYHKAQREVYREVARRSSTITKQSLPTRRQIALRRIQEKLHAAPAKALSGSEELESVLPVKDRRATWRELQAEGFELPELEVSSGVFWIVATMVLTPLGLLILTLRNWFALFSIVEFIFLAYKLSRPLAIHPPPWCRTVGQAALCLRNIRTAACVVAWTPEEIVERVRMIIAESAGVPIEEVKESSRITDFVDC